MEKEKFAEIIDKGECMSTLYQYPTFPWPAPFLKTVACKEEWARHGFYPSNGLIGEVAYNLESQVYILKINDTFYVPMTRKGIQFISEVDYQNKKSAQSIRGMDDRQTKINDAWDKLTNKKLMIMDYRDEFSIKQLKSLNLKNVFRNDLVNEVDKASDGFTRPIMVDQLGRIVEKYAYEMCKEFKDKSDFITPAIRDFICEEVFDAIDSISPEFDIVRHDVKTRLISRI